MPNQSFEEKMLRMRLEYLREEFSELLSRKNEMICHEENYLENLYLMTFGQKNYDIYCLKLDIAILKRRIEYLNQYIHRNRIPDLKLIEQEIKRDFETYLIESEEKALKLSISTEYSQTNLLDVELLHRATALYRSIVPHIHPKIYQESCPQCVSFLEQTNSAYILLDIALLEEIASITMHIHKEDRFENVKQFHKFVETVESTVKKLKIVVEKMNLDFPFNYRKKLNDKMWIDLENNKLEAEIEMLAIEKNHLADEVILNQLWKPDNLN